MNKFDVGIIGAGVAGAFAALRISEHYPDSKAILFDLGRPPGKRRRQLEGWFGCFPSGDGKIYPNDLENVLNIVDGRKAKPANNWVMSKLEQVGSLKIIKDPLPQATLQKKIKDLNFGLKGNNYIQWKPEQIHQLSKSIAETIEANTNLQFSFDNEVYSVVKKKNHFVVSTANGEFFCHKLILCVGRSGWRWVTNLYKELGITSNDDFASFGIRVEIAGQYVKEFNRSHCTLTKDKLEIGPFSWNGTVIPEDHADVVISSFRSNEERWKSEKVSFSILSSRYFKNQGVYQTDRLGKLAFLLFNDRVSREKIRSYMKNNSQLSLLPEYNWLMEVLAEVEALIPQLSSRGYFHVPNISPMASQIRLGTNLESEINGMYVAGESAGIRGILASAIMGSVAADSACRE
jgi:hypothetical protein